MSAKSKRPPSSADAIPASARSAPRARNFEWTILAAILLIGFLLRAWYLAEIVHAPDFTAPQQDPAVQDYHARGIAFGDWTLPPGAETDPEIRTTSYFRPPGHAYFLSAIYFLTRGSYLAPRLVNMFLGLVSVVLLYALGKALFHRGAGLIAAFFAATYWGFIFWEGELNDPSLFVFLGSLLMYVLLRWSGKMAVRWAALAGIIFGSYALMRPNILLFGPFTAAWMLWIAYRRGQTLRAMPSWVALAFCTFAIIAPVTVRNYVVAHEFVPISNYFGENFLIGNGPEADGVTPWTPYLQDLEGTGNWSVWVYINVIRGVGKVTGNPNIKGGEVSNFFYKQTLDYIKTHKWRTLKLMFKKAVLFWTPVEITCNKVVQCEKEYYPPLKYLPGFAMAFALFLGGVAIMLNDLRLRRFMRGEAADTFATTDLVVLMAVFLAIYFVSFLPFFVNGRARIPVIPFCFLFGAYGLWRLVEYAKARQWLKAGAGVGLFVVFGVLASIQFIRFEPDRCRWYYQRADSYLRIGEVDKAVEEARHLVDNPNVESYMNMRLARWFEKEGRTSDAFDQLMTALRNHPADPDVQFSGASELIAMGKVAEGIAHYNEVIRLNPSDARAHNNLGVLLENQGKFDEALAQYREAIRVAPDFSLAWNNLGSLLGRAGRYEEAIANFEKAIESDPEHEDYQYNLAVQLANAGRTDEAIERYTKALQLNPDDARAQNNLGLLLAARKQYDEAERHYNEALRAVPDFVLVYANLGNMRVEQGRPDEGIAMYRKGLEIRPDDAGLHNGLGYLYAGQGDLDNAIREYNEALRIAPDFPLAHNNLGNALRSQKKMDEAVAQYRQALKVDPWDRNAYLNLGDTAYERGALDEAIAEYLKALKNDPRNAVIPNNLANALAKSARFPEAIKYYQVALQLDPKYVNAMCNLATVLFNAGDTTQALTYFKRALGLDPNNAIAREGVRAITGASS